MFPAASMHRIPASSYRILIGTSALAALALVSFAIYQALQGHWIPAGIIGASTLALALAITWLHRQHHDVRPSPVAGDEPTAAGGRHGMERTLSEAMERNQRYGEPCSLIAFRVDETKSGSGGAAPGAADRVSAELAWLVDDRIRSMDRLFRFGRETFVLMLPHAGEQPAWQLAEALRQEVEEHGFSDANRVTVSAGVAELTDEESLEPWLERAERAMLAAVRAGGNRVNPDPGSRATGVAHPSNTAVTAERG